MKYQDLVNYLEDQGCYEDEDGKFAHGSFYRNCVNGYICYIQKVDIFGLTTYCHIFHELGIAPPFDLESDYEVYNTFRVEADKHEKGKL